MDAMQKTIILPDEGIRQRIMHTYHDGLAGHPGRDETIRKVLDRFCWPGGQA